MRHVPRLDGADVSDCKPSSTRTTCLGRQPLTPRIAAAIGDVSVTPLAQGIAYLFAAVSDGMAGPYCYGRRASVDEAQCPTFTATCAGARR